MTKKYLAFTLAAVAIFLNLIIPACGSKSGNNSTNPYLGYSCTPGQVCTGVSGTPMFPTAVTSSIDSYGSAAQMQFYASNYSAGQSGSVPINVQAQVYISSGNGWGCPPGNYFVQGSGSFVPNYGGSYGLVTAQLQGSSGFQVQLYGQIFGGQDPFQSQATQYFYQGKFGNSCDPTAIAQ